MWWEWGKQAGAWGLGNMRAAAFFYAPRQYRDLLLGDLSRTTDRYLRSPPFLDWMRSNLAVVSRSTELLFPNRLK